MSELLLELFSDEIPAMMQDPACRAYKEIFIKYFASLKIEYKEIEVNVGPRRLSIYVNGLPAILPKSLTEKKGPKVSAPEQAIEGFCHSNNIDKNQLEIRKIRNVDFYFYNHVSNEQKIEDLLLKSLDILISKYVWPKSMYWGDYKVKWVRPLQNILCVFDGKVIPFKYGNLTANNVCYGHRFMSYNSANISNYDEYKKHLANNFVILEAEERKKLIKDSINKIVLDKNLVIKEDPYLLEEVSGLVEYPRTLLGTIDQKFLSVPEEVLISVMRTHQKYFSVFDEKGNFAPYFIFVSNIKSTDELSVIQGNEKVLSARLADALYFYHQDLKTTLLDKYNNLDKVIFHAKLGSLRDKTHRIEKLCQYLDKNNKALLEAARVCKSDIVSEVVGEFPNLQGIMGYYYSLAESDQQDIAESIRDHYKPQGPNDQSPKGSAALLALADKIDSLCGLILAGEKPNGSKDPYALRRQALGIIRIILENNLNIELSDIVNYTLSLYDNKISDIGKCQQEILQFFAERIKYFFKQNYSSGLIASILDIDKQSNILIIASKIEILANFIKSDKGKELIESYKRANNLLGKTRISGTIDQSMFTSNYEKELFSCLKANEEKIITSIDQNDYEQSLILLNSFYIPLSKFLANILVKDENRSVANNRMLMLEEIRMIFNKIAKFDKF